MWHVPESLLDRCGRSHVLDGLLGGQSDDGAGHATAGVPRLEAAGVPAPSHVVLQAVSTPHTAFGRVF